MKWPPIFFPVRVGGSEWGSWLDPDRYDHCIYVSSDWFFVLYLMTLVCFQSHTTNIHSPVTVAMCLIYTHTYTHMDCHSYLIHDVTVITSAYSWFWPHSGPNSNPSLQYKDACRDCAVGIMYMFIIIVIIQYMSVVLAKCFFNSDESVRATSSPLTC